MPVDVRLAADMFRVTPDLAIDPPGTRRRSITKIVAVGDIPFPFFLGREGLVGDVMLPKGNGAGRNADRTAICEPCGL